MFADSFKESLVHLKKILLDMDVLRTPDQSVSNLAFVSKVMEKVVAMRLYRHMGVSMISWKSSRVHTRSLTAQRQAWVGFRATF